MSGDPYSPKILTKTNTGEGHEQSNMVYLSCPLECLFEIKQHIVIVHHHISGTWLIEHPSNKVLNALFEIIKCLPTRITNTNPLSAFTEYISYLGKYKEFFDECCDENKTLLMAGILGSRQ